MVLQTPGTVPPSLSPQANPTLSLSLSLSLSLLLFNASSASHPSLLNQTVVSSYPPLPYLSLIQVRHRTKKEKREKTKKFKPWTPVTSKMKKTGMKCYSMGVANDEKVDLVTFMFKGEALHWWEATERLLTMPVPGVVPVVPQRITWARFQRGLNFKIRKELTGQGVITNYAELVHRAKMIEKDVMEEEEMKERYKKQKFSGQSGGSFGSGVTRSGGQRPQNSRGQSFHSQNRGARSGGNQFNRSTSGGNTNGNRGGSQRCFRCGAVGHLIRDCPQPDKGVTCYRCGQPGHIATYCDQQITTVVSSVGSAKNTGIGPSGSGQGGGRGSVGRPAVNGRVFAMSRQDAQATPEVVAVRADLFSGLKSLRVSLAVGACGSLLATLTLRPTLIDRIREAQNSDSNMARIKAERSEFSIGSIDDTDIRGPCKGRSGHASWILIQLYDFSFPSKAAKRRLRQPGIVPLACAKVMKKLNFCG
ncbi:hypothetical protein Vadar_012545 [Vaccinium darrowii]|uniref:Uncharacterized protein n=1 Tax=Vaccinium darrowii TaxID=229202 RepID=A0ACB7XQD5_9ERIC|nr:hypothetical protein Vadar_012545 [Vaccinium darrowii]